MKYEYWNDDSVRYYIFEYDGQPIGLIVYVIVNGKIAYQIANKGIKHMIIQHKIPEHVEKRLGAYMHYITVEDLWSKNIKHLYCGSALEHRKPSLKIYKSIMNDTPIACNVYNSN
jgi:predicted acetyltransferase